ncbi:pali-domain-containing protein [Leucogyrophana mollusca]|uniref:Pali-domain-containing protein n=1 Tax=Leucogyrophana mollusca TaxID=85980 RepID=A0ACB8BEX8_9AGAM|nr:pali-domain-containing protein [Leucogyrophana mollusca]
MGFIRPATPGFLVTLVATVLLAVVSFSVPLIKSVYFLKASLAVENINGDITFGTLGYCMDIAGNNTCSKASVGYQLDINQLVGDNTAIQIPEVAVKWLTYALVLHIVAFGLAAVAALFGLLAHVREMAMTCFSSCISGFAATVALAAFIFDIALFFIAKSRLNSVAGGSASIGNAVWITLVSWVLLFFSGCFYGIGRCCIKRRPRNDWAKDGNPAGGYGDQMRLDAVKAEADRKARQNQGEVGLPSFQEYDPSQPLKAKVYGDEVYTDDEESVPYRDTQSISTAGQAGMGSYGRRPSQTGYAGGGYVQGARGTRAVDEYNNSSTYPPQAPQRQGSTYTQTSSSAYSQPTTAHGPSNAYPGLAAAAIPPVPRDPSPNAYYNQDPYAPQAYGHTAGGNSYNNTAPQQYTSYDPYASQPGSHYQDPPFNPSAFNTAAAIPASSSQSPYTNPYTSQPPTAHQPERSYTLGGGGYGDNVVPPTQNTDPYYSGHYQGSSSQSPPPLNTSVMAMPSHTSPVKGPRGARTSMIASPPPSTYAEGPPTYESGPSGAPGRWGTKG